MIKTGRWGFVALVTIFVFCLTSFADVKISSSIDRKEVELGDSFVLTLKVESSGSVDVERPQFPATGKFDVLNVSQSTQQNVMFQNGKIVSQRSTSYMFELQPKVKGDLAIPGLKVGVDGKLQTSTALRVKVVDAGTLPNRQANRARPSQPGAGNSPFGNFPGFGSDPFEDLLRRRNTAPEPKQDTAVKLNPNEAFQIRVLADKKEAFVGEQITANYYIYIPRNYLLRSFDTVKYPNLQGFWKEDIELAQTLRYETVVVEGRSYNRALLASFALFPIKEGRSTLDEYKAKASVSVSGVFGLGKARSYTKSSRGEKVTIKPLPLEGMPENFSGAVGTYTVKAKIDTPKIIAHQPFAYKLKIEGNGNAKNIELPDINLPPELELFDTKEESQFFKTGSSFKEFTLYLIPRVDGNIQIPELKISVFNPENQKYEEIRSGELVISAAPGEKPQGVESPLANGDNSSAPKEKELGSFQFEKTTPGVLSSFENLISLFLLIVVLLSSFFYAKKEFSWGSTEAKQIQIYETRYKKLSGLLKKSDFRGLGLEATNTIYSTLSLCLEDVESGMEIDKILKKISPNIRKEIEEPLSKSLKVFQTLGFAPDEILGSLKDPKLLKKNLKLMDTALRTLIKRHET